MNSRQFFWTNILLSSNIIFYIGQIVFFYINVAYIIGTYIYFLEYINGYMIIGSYFFYIILKILWLPLLTFKKFKRTFSYKFLRKFNSNKTFKLKILISALVADCLFSFIQLGFIFGFLNTPESSSNLNWSQYLLLIFLIYIFSGTGIVLSYLSLIIWQKIRYIYRSLDKIDILTKETIDEFVIEKIQKEIERIKNNVQSYANEYKDLSLKLKAEKLTVDAGVKIASPLARDAAAIWQLASSKFTRGLDYIEKNGKLINKITDLNNKELQDAVRKKLDTQLQQTEARGVQFHPNSSISKSVANSEEFKKIVSKNMDRLIYKKETIPKVSTFLKKNFNNYMALHGCDILNIRVENGMLHAFIIDTVDYNLNDWKVKLPRDLQEGGAIENFYVIIKIEEPISIYFDL